MSAMKPDALLWVVEMKCAGNWEPTVGAKLSRRDGREELAEWKRDNPCDQFRLVPYERRAK